MGWLRQVDERNVAAIKNSQMASFKAVVVEFLADSKEILLTTNDRYVATLSQVLFAQQMETKSCFDEYSHDVVLAHQQEHYQVSSWSLYIHDSAGSCPQMKVCMKCLDLEDDDGFTPLAYSVFIAATDGSKRMGYCLCQEGLASDTLSLT